MNFRRPFSRLLVLFFRLGFVFAEPVVKADGVFQLAAGGARADAGTAWMARVSWYTSLTDCSALEMP